MGPENGSAFRTELGYETWVPLRAPRWAPTVGVRGAAGAEGCRGMVACGIVDAPDCFQRQTASARCRPWMRLLRPLLVPRPGLNEASGNRSRFEVYANLGIKPTAFPGPKKWTQKGTRFETPNQAHPINF